MNENAAAGLAAYRAAVAAGETAPDRKTPWEKLRANPTSRTLAIHAMCAGCMGWGEGQDRPPGNIGDIRGCTSTQCPLYNFRPYRSGTVDQQEE